MVSLFYDIFIDDVLCMTNWKLKTYFDFSWRRIIDTTPHLSFDIAVFQVLCSIFIDVL